MPSSTNDIILGFNRSGHPIPMLSHLLSRHMYLVGQIGKNLSPLHNENGVQ